MSNKLKFKSKEKSEAKPTPKSTSGKNFTGAMNNSGKVNKGNFAGRTQKSFTTKKK